jgi:hypothetical protein
MNIRDRSEDLVVDGKAILEWLRETMCCLEARTIGGGGEALVNMVIDFRAP